MLHQVCMTCGSTRVRVVDAPRCRKRWTIKTVHFEETARCYGAPGHEGECVLRPWPWLRPSDTVVTFAVTPAPDAEEE